MWQKYVRLRYVPVYSRAAVCGHLVTRRFSVRIHVCVCRLAVMNSHGLGGVRLFVASICPWPSTMVDVTP